VGTETPGRRPSAIVTSGGYLLLFALGAVEGLLGAFWYAASLGPVPVAALGFAVGILVTTIGAAWGMQAATAGLMPAVGWFAAVFILAMPTRGGSVLITNTGAGKWFLYGSTLCVLAGVVTSFATQGRVRAQGRGSSRPVGPRHAAPRTPGTPGAPASPGRPRPGQEPGQ
jgi:hypothetical protein